jgi:YD repeat-containing protein
MALTLAASVFAQDVLNDYQMQPEVWHMMRPGYGEVDAQGDLNLQIPAMTVPGRNIDIPITFSYHSGIKFHQHASWLGLGWQWDPGSITRDVKGSVIFNVGDEIDESMGVDFPGANEAYARDIYYLHVNGSTKAMFEKGLATGLEPGSDFYVNPWEAWIILPEAVEYVSVKEMTSSLPDYTGFRVTTDDGVRYIYGVPSLASYQNIGPDDPGGYDPNYFVSTWRLVAILGTDYQGDDIPDEEMNPPGSWVKFNYAYDEAALFLSRRNYAGQPGKESLVNLTYLKEIVTPTHIAKFTTTLRTDHDGAIPPEIDEYVHKKLSRIDLYSRHDPAHAIKSVELIHDDFGHSSSTKMGLIGLKINGEDDSGPLVYTFTYYDTHHESLNMKEEHYDDFGYINASFFREYNSDKISAKYLSLENIVYPTGGSETFFYSTDSIRSNEKIYFSWYKYAVPNEDLFDSDSVAFEVNENEQGGTRVRKIIRSDGRGGQYEFKYQYPAGVINGIPQYFFLKRNAELGLNNSGARGDASVYYDYIIKIYPDNSRKTTWYSRGDKSNSLVCTAFSNKLNYSVLRDNRDWQWGMPETIEYEDPNQKLIYRKKILYNSGVEHKIFENTPYASPGSWPAEYVNYYIGHKNVNTENSFLYSDEESNDPFSQYVNFDYSDKNQLIRKTEKNFYGDQGGKTLTEDRTTEFRNAYEFYPELEEKNILSAKAVKTISSFNNEAVEYVSDSVSTGILSIEGTKKDSMVISLGFSTPVSYKVDMLWNGETYQKNLRIGEYLYVYKMSGGTEIEILRENESTEGWKSFYAEAGNDYKIVAYVSQEIVGIDGSIPMEEALRCSATIIYPNSSGNRYHTSEVTTYKAFMTGENDTTWYPHRHFVWCDESYTDSPVNFPGDVFADETMTPSDPRWKCISVNNSFDAYGHVIEKEDAKGNVTNLYYGSNETNLSNASGSLFHAYLTGVESSGLSKQFDYYTKTGLVKSITDVNGDTMHFSYDQFGRLDSILNAHGDCVSDYAYHMSQDISQEPNRIVMRAHLDENLVTESVEYFDGLGRLIQTQTKTDATYHALSMIEYDYLDREHKVWKPYFYDTEGNYQNKTWFEFNCIAYYNGEQGPDCGSMPYTETRYLNDPENRIVSIHPPSPEFHDNHYLRYQYRTNQSGEVPGYAKASLYATITIDENGRASSAYQDKLGRTVAEYQYCDLNDLTQNDFLTMFIYDIRDNMTLIIPPEAEGDSTSPLCTKMKYNSLNQVIERSSPDAGVVRYKYDGNGNMRFVQDANHKSGGRDLIFYQYDSFNRLTATGEASADATIPDWDQLDGNVLYTTGTHDFENESNYVIVHGFDHLPAYGEGIIWEDASDPGAQRNILGKIAATAYRDDDTGDWGYTYYSYDGFGQVEWIARQLPGQDISMKKISYIRDRQGNVVQIAYQDDADDCFYIWYDYDRTGRVEQIHAGHEDVKTSAEPIAGYEYWPTGNTKRIVMGNNIQGVDYVYNARDWLVQINDQTLYDSNKDPGHDGPNGSSQVKVYDAFAEVIGYNDPPVMNEVLSDPVEAQYNGNISWLMTATSSANPMLSGYAYSYDNVYRLTQADYCYWTDNDWTQQIADGFDVRNLNYDKNGNLLSLTRHAEDGTPSHYHYRYIANTNQLKNTTGNSGDETYLYDPNGNLITDNQKQFSVVNNMNNLPYRVLYDSGFWLRFGYDAKNQRIKKKANINK